MSTYRERAIPTLSYLDNLNTINPFDDEFSGELVNDDFGMFTNAEFRDLDSFPMPEQIGNGPNVLESFDIPSIDLQPSTETPVFQSYGTPIQPAPPAGGFPIGEDFAQNSIPHTSGLTAPSSTSDESSRGLSNPADENARLAAEEDKRRRNTAASARFRVKKKQREQALERTVKDAHDKNTQLEVRVRQLETENVWLKNLITEKNGKESKEEMAAAYQKFRKESEERELKATKETKMTSV